MRSNFKNQDSSQFVLTFKIEVLRISGDLCLFCGTMSPISPTVTFRNDSFEKFSENLIACPMDLEVRSTSICC